MTLAGVLSGVWIYLACQGTFSGHPTYHVDLLGVIALILTAATGGIALMIDRRRTGADGCG